MAAVDPIHFKNAINLFSQLSETQALNCYLFATGANYQEISELRDKSPVSIKKTLEKAQSNLELYSVQSIRQVFLTRILFNVFFFILTGNTRGACLKSDVSTLKVKLGEESDSSRLFPELDIDKSLLMCVYCSGERMADIYDVFEVNALQLQKEIEGFLKTLKINSIQTLRILVLTRLEAFLASKTFFIY